MDPTAGKDLSVQPQKKRKFATGSQKRINLAKKLLSDAGKAPGQKNLYDLFSSASTSATVVKTISPVASPSPIAPPVRPVALDVPPEWSSAVSPVSSAVSPVASFEDTSRQTTSTALHADCNLNEDSSSTEHSDEEIVQHSGANIFNAEVNIFIPPPLTASTHEKLSFLKKHPIQPTSSNERKLPFSGTRVYERKLPNEKYIVRHWVSYSSNLGKLFCSICMVFSQCREKSTFSSTGCQDWTHIYTRVEEHENSLAHTHSVDAYMMAQSSLDVASMINVELMNERRRQVAQNRCVLGRLIDIIYFVGKMGLAYRGKHEACYFLNQESASRGIFLDLVTLVSKYDEPLRMHVDKAMSESKKRKEKATGKGRGNLVTFLSKTTVNKLIVIIGQLFKEHISNEVKRADKFSVQLDSTQDIAVIEQCSIVVRFVDGVTVKERLLSLIDVKQSTGKSYFDSLQEELVKNGLKVQDIIGCSFDGAANMSGQYSGLQKYIKDNSPVSLYTWCHAHILNLVVSDATQSALASKNYFGLLGRTACFLNESNKRMTVWKAIVDEGHVRGHAKLKRLKQIADTRWWSKASAINNVLGTYYDQSGGAYSTLVDVLDAIATCGKFDAITASEAKSLLQAWLSYETIVISFVFLALFEILSPVSKYLQTQGIDFIQASRLVDNAKKDVSQMFTRFQEIDRKATGFVMSIDESKEFSSDVDIQTEFPKRRLSRKKKMSGENSNDERVLDEKKRFEIETFKVIVNQTSVSIEQRFSKNENVFRSISCFDPQRFTDILREDIPLSSLETVARMSGLDADCIKSELLSFAKNFRRLNMSFRTELNVCIADDDEDGYSSSEDEVYQEQDNNEDNADQHLPSRNVCTEALSTRRKCEGCIPCCFKVLHTYNLHSSAYSNLYIAYKTILTLSCTQVQCERIFSKLKIIKSRLRSTLGQNLLEPLMLMNVERDLINDITHDTVIDRLAMSSTAFKRLLM